MSVYGEFFTKFMGPLFEGFIKIFKGLGEGLFQMFNVVTYITVIGDYKSDLKGLGLLVMVLSIVFLLAIMALIVFLIYKSVKTYLRYRRNVKKEDMLVEEIDSLNNEIFKLKRNAEKFSELANANGEIEYNEDGTPKNELKEGESRFFKLSTVDAKFKDYTPEEIVNNFTLESFCDTFRNYSASKLHLYYDINLIRLFIASFASNKLIILEGISGTGKTSLAYAFGSFVDNETTVASVQPSWRDSTEIFGYFNEFTKKFNETAILEKMYEAQYNDEVYITLLDEMNISRVEYYFAEMLSILEMPNKDEWIIELVSSAWKSDPKHIIDGKIKIPANVWYIGTINNDDSTYMVTDKVYDRAMPIDINDKGKVFEPIDTDAMDINYSYLDNLFKSAMEQNQISKETLDKIEDMDDYVIKHFRIAFGNRIVAHMKKFVPVYVACGGDEVSGVDYFIARKILRKFEQLNVSYIRDEIDGYIEYLNKTFGKDKMKECIEYLLRLKKLT